MDSRDVGSVLVWSDLYTLIPYLFIPVLSVEEQRSQRRLFSPSRVHFDSYQYVRSYLGSERATCLQPLSRPFVKRLDRCATCAIQLSSTRLLPVRQANARIAICGRSTLLLPLTRPSVCVYGSYVAEQVAYLTPLMLAGHDMSTCTMCRRVFSSRGRQDNSYCRRVRRSKPGRKLVEQ